MQLSLYLVLHIYDDYAIMYLLYYNLFYEVYLWLLVIRNYGSF